MEEREPVIKILYENTTRPVNRVLLTFPLSGREKPEQKMLSLIRGHEGKSSIPFRITKVESPINVVNLSHSYSFLHSRKKFKKFNKNT